MSHNLWLIPFYWYGYLHSILKFNFICFVIKPFTREIICLNGVNHAINQVKDWNFTIEIIVWPLTDRYHRYLHRYVYLPGVFSTLLRILLIGFEKIQKKMLWNKSNEVNQAPIPIHPSCWSKLFPFLGLIDLEQQMPTLALKTGSWKDRKLKDRKFKYDRKYIRY